MENNNKSKLTNISSKFTSVNSDHLKELERKIQSHTKRVTVKQVNINSEIMKKNSEKILLLKKKSLAIASILDEKKIEGFVNTLLDETQKSLNNLDNFSALLNLADNFPKENFFDFNLAKLFIDLNHLFRKKYSNLCSRIKCLEEKDLESIKKLQNIFQEDSNVKHGTSFSVQLVPLYREYSFVLADSEGKTQKFVEKENTNKSNSLKAEMYTKELVSTTEKYELAKANHEKLDHEYNSLLTNKLNCEKALKYLQDSLIEKKKKNSKKILSYHIQEDDNIAKKIFQENLSLMKEIENNKLYLEDICSVLSKFKVLEQQINEAKQNQFKFVKQSLGLALVINRLKNAKLNQEALLSLQAPTSKALATLENLIASLNAYQSKHHELISLQNQRAIQQKQYNKLKKTYEKICNL